ncbi:hypothetical protein A2367_02435 [Candidatus Shapirobacteria bacterium RIFOXYB1_FULL_38_38]|uniref:Glycosyltransferase RgtA/B/C/D-like domain-containing protein n=3 Tax=Patescibacteria group TaxID=1783273 RepID=A0A0G0N2N0_9BACT|nr:MAG: hypothetical protein US90_C0003G0029 [Candidatus Shapirobacteria bacterium GW2011_GWE2_38_30]OGJ06720.1 MAG: hypothetical protein A2192_01965 [Candidatus Nomurabacteria bacterium RIFOXYA1_FULL_35_17]OGL56183.1 MAG: hypothetical protein A2367_02435 [Candidatus Shapirobacteria bacterium RIFOXYB1_FULL_38_38]HAP37902.1 hypothetical protein [Candidatus Shapirobacteria bacterium]
MRKHWYKIIVLLILMFIFLTLRFYNIDQSLFFWNDMGRDLSVLQQWQSTGKPPLLGPQTSALPINQSAIYFYLLYPAFLLLNGHPIANLITLAFLYIVVFLVSLYLVKRFKIPIPISQIIVIFFLTGIHPQYIIQGRFVWNPSFVTPFLIVAFYSFYLLLIKFSWNKLIIFSLAIATAISLSYSVAPLLIAVFIYWLLFYRQHFFKFFFSLTMAFVLLNITTIAFEFRHDFLLTTSLFTKQVPVQESITFLDKTTKLSDFIFITGNSSLNLCLFILMLFACLATLYKFRHSRKSVQFLSSFLLLTLTFIAYLTPVTVQPHYIFGYAALLFILIASQPPVRITFLLLIASILYLNPSQLNFHFRPAPRTYSQMQQCFQNYCSQLKSSTFVSVQSSFHPFHNGPEHRYLMRQSGCRVLDIETQNSQTNTMSVILDNGSFDDKTNYYELELFGKFKQSDSFNCLPNFSILTLEKISTNIQN